MSGNTLYIDLSKIVKMTDSDIPVALEIPADAFSDGQLELCSSVKITGRIVNLSGMLSINATLEFSVEYKCDRCLTAFEKDCKLELSEDIAPENSQEREADEYIPYKSNRMLLTDAVYKCIFSGMDIKNVCKPDCKGLCGMCGIDLNNGSCSCGEEEIDPRLLKLKELLK